MSPQRFGVCNRMVKGPLQLWRKGLTMRYVATLLQQQKTSVEQPPTRFLWKSHKLQNGYYARETLFHAVTSVKVAHSESIDLYLGVVSAQAFTKLVWSAHLESTPHTQVVHTATNLPFLNTEAKKFLKQLRCLQQGDLWWTHTCNQSSDFSFTFHFSWLSSSFHLLLILPNGGWK